MTDFNKRVEEAKALHDAALKALTDVPDIYELEAMRMSATDELEKKAIEFALLLAKREYKAEFEESDRWSDALDKAALPASAAIPAFFTLMNSQHLLPRRLDADATGLLFYLAGAVLWIACRVGSTWFGMKAKTGMARLGKVD